MEFEDKVCIITGGASGIGLALCTELAARGARVVLTDINEAGARAAAERLGERVRAVTLDVTVAEGVGRLIETVAADEGRVDLVVNNAGIAVSGDARDLELEHWQRVVDVNLMGVIYGTDAAYKLMAAQGHGHIVNIASLAGLIPFPSNLPYSATKFAVVGMSRSLRIEGEDLGVKVSVVCPGFIESNIYTASEAVNLPGEKLAEDIPFSKVPADVAARRILKGIARNEAVIVFPGYAKFFWWLERFNRNLGLPLSRRLIRDIRKLREKA